MVKKRHKRRRFSLKRLRDHRKGKPLIGLTCEVVKLKPYFAEFELVCDYRYIRAILRAGGTPVIIPINPFQRDIKSIMETIEGLVIPGGADLHPSFYEEKSREKVKPIYRGRTYFEMSLIREAKKKKIPIFGICYGMQLLNVYHGGSLHQDIQTDVKGSRSHRSKRKPLHKVTVQPGSLLHQIFKEKSIDVHSEHHQAVKLPGKGLKVTAVSEDGIPEALEGPDQVLAVQWHPERQAKDTHQKKLFTHFLAQVRKSRALRNAQQ